MHPSPCPKYRLGRIIVPESTSLSADNGPGVIAQADLNDLVAIRLAVTNTAGNPITTVNVGDTFQLRGYVQSIAASADDGVYAAFLDVTFNASLASPSGLIEHGTNYTNGTSGTILGGVMEEVGGLQGTTITNPAAEHLLFQQVFTATGAGTLTFAGNSADVSPLHDTVLFDPPQIVATDKIDYGSISVQIQGAGVQDLVQFAKNLKTANAVLYGAAWDASSTSQKQLFQDGESYLTFVDVTNSDRTNNATATEKNITTKPTWIFANGQRLEGVKTFAEIATASGIPIPLSDSPSLAPTAPRPCSVDTLFWSHWMATIRILGHLRTVSRPAIRPSKHRRSSRRRTRVCGLRSPVLVIWCSNFSTTGSPGATSHIEQLANENFYDNVSLHRVENGFVIQGGDKLGTGAGGSELGDFDDQFDVDLQHVQTGLLSMAKTDDDTNDSQFFIRRRDPQGTSISTTRYLDIWWKVKPTAKRLVTHRSMEQEAHFSVTMSDVIVFDDEENAVVMLKAAEGASGNTTITVTITDAQGKSVNQTFTVNVTPDTSNGNPFLTDFAQETYTAKHDVPITIPFNGIDVEGNPITYEAAISFGPKGLTPTLDTVNKTVTVTPPAGFAGEIDLIIGAFRPTARLIRKFLNCNLLALTFGRIPTPVCLRSTTLRTPTNWKFELPAYPIMRP